MEFFVPTAKSSEVAEHIWEGTVKFAKENFGWTVKDRRIFRLEYFDEGKDCIDEVGKPSHPNFHFKTPYLFGSGSCGWFLLRGQQLRRPNVSSLRP